MLKNRKSAQDQAQYHDQRTIQCKASALWETSRSARNVKDTCLPIVTCFTNIKRTYKNMDVHSVHNASCLYVHVWAQERGKEVNYACRCRVAQSTAKHLFSDFQTENTTHEFDMTKNHCRRDLQTEGWTHQQKTSLTKLGNKKLSSSATPSYIISQCLVSSCIILDFQTENTIREFDSWDGHHCRTYQPKFGLKKNTCYSILIYNFPHKLAKKARYHDAVNYMHHTVLEGNIHKGTTNPTAW